MKASPCISIRFRSPAIWLIILFIFSATSWSFAQITTGGSGFWSSTTANAPWTTGTVPIAGQTVTINSGHVVTLDVNTAITLSSITINPGGTLLTTGSFTIDATTITVGGTFTNGSTGAVTVADWFVNGGATYEHAVNGGTIPVASGTRSWAATSNCIISGVTGTAPSPAGYAVPFPGFGNFIWNSPGQSTNIYLEASFNVQGNLEILDSGLPIAPGTRAVRLSQFGASYTINVAGDFIVDNATFKMNNDTGDCFINVAGNVLVDNTGFLTLCTGNSDALLTVSGNVDILGSSTLLMQEDNNAGVLGTLDVNGDLSIGVGSTVTETEVNGIGEILFTGAGTQTFTNAGTMSNQINVTVNPGVRLQMGSPTTTVGGTGTFLLSAGASLGVTSADGITTAGAVGNVQVTGTRTYSSGANYIYNGSADQNTGNGLTQNTPNNIEIDNAGNTVSLSAATSLTGNLTITAGTLSASGNTVTFNGTGAQVISSTSTSQSFSGLTLNKAAGALSVGGSLTDISTGSILMLSGTFNAPPNLIVGGDFTNNGATFVPGTGTVIFNRPAVQSINGSVLTQTFNNLVVNKAGGTLSAAGLTALNVNNYTQTLGDFTGPPSLNVAGDVLLTLGTFTAGTNTNVSGDWTNNGGAFVPGTNTVTFNGAGPQSINGTAPTQTFNNLVVSKGGGTLTVGGSTATLNASNYTQTAGNFTANTTTNVFGFTIGAGTYTAGTNTNVAGNFTNNGATFDGNGGTVTFNGGVLQTIGGASGTTFNNVNTSVAGTIAQATTATTISSNLTIADGTQFTIATPIFSVGGGTNIGSGTSGVLAISNSSASKTFTGLVLLNSGATWNNTANAPVTFQGGITNSGTFNAGSGIQTFNTNPQALSGTFVIPSITSDIALTNGNSLTVGTALEGSGSIIQAVAATLDLGGSVGITTITASNADNVVSYSGNSQSVRAVTYENLEINQSSGEASLAGSTVVNKALTLTARNLNLNGHVLTFGTTGSIDPLAFSASRMIIASGGGSVTKQNLTGSFDFPIGDNTGMLEYSPVTVNVTAGGPSDISVSVQDGKHPNNASATHFISRYWDVNSSVGGVTATITGIYDANDINGNQVDTRSARLSGAFNQTSNPWVKSAEFLGGNTLTFTGSSLAAGPNVFTGITDADPTVSITNLPDPYVICDGSSFMLTTALGGGEDPIVSYLWTGAGLSSNSIPNPVFTASYVAGLPVTYNVDAIDGNGIIGSDQIDITVRALPIVQTLSAPVGTSYCQGSPNITVRVDATESGFSYQLYKGAVA
ncbi:MAG: G8 domain-containing protein, partial [Cyclobacteriaceae bacterium]